LRRRFRCRSDILSLLKREYNNIVSNQYGGDFLKAIQDFDAIAETRLRVILDAFYKSPRSRDQAWRTCKGELYEYAVFKCVQQVVSSDELLSRKFKVVPGNQVATYEDQVAIRNWSEVLPDIDILIVERETDRVRVIISCKTSLRERFTETAFWKRELERHESTRDLLLVFITTDKDDELRKDTNRYILLHVVDCTFITDFEKHRQLIRAYRERYGGRRDFARIYSKVKRIDEIKEFLHMLSKE